MPEWLDRLRTASYISPSGIESFFKYDIVSRTGGKKTSIHEILNSDESIIQEQGNRINSYPMNIYFVGDNGDQQADNFISSLEEEYSPDNPGTLKHPRWGDISVIPFEWQQNENYVNGAGIFRCQVEFKESIPLTTSQLAGLNESEIVANIDSLETAIDTANEGIIVTASSRYAEFRATMSEVVDIIVKGIGSVANAVDSVNDEFRAIQDDIERALSVGTSAVEIMSMVNNLIRLPSQIATDTINKVQLFTSLLIPTEKTNVSDPIANSPIIRTFTDKVNPKLNRQGQINNAIMLQSISSMIVGATIESSLFTNLETRDTAGATIDLINSIASLVDEATLSVYQTLSDPDQANVNITNTFTPDHNTSLLLGQITGQANSLLIDRSFSLKAKKTITVMNPIDALSLCYKLYGTIDKLEFFITTNRLTDVEMIEIPAGRSVVAYV